MMMESARKDQAYMPDSYDDAGFLPLSEIRTMICSIPAIYDRMIRASRDGVRRCLGDATRAMAPFVDAEVIARTELVLAELLNNIAEHGMLSLPECAHCNFCIYPSGEAVIRLRLSVYENGIACVLTDSGAEIPQNCLAKVYPPPPQTLPEGGFGWPLINGLTRCLHYSRSGQRNILVFLVPA